MGVLEKIFIKLSIPMPRPRIRLPQYPATVGAMYDQTVTPAQAALALGAVGGKFLSERNSMHWARRKALLPPDDLGDRVSWPQLSYMLYRFARAARVNIPLQGTGRVFDLPDFASLPRWSLPGLQWCLSAGLLPEDITGPVTGWALDEMLERYCQLLAYTREELLLQEKIQLFGDSITDDSWGDCTTWVSFFPHRLGDRRPVLVNNAYGGGNLTAVPGKKNCVVKLLPAMLHPDSDTVVVFAGTNDFAAGTPGTGQPGSTDPATFWGAYGTIHHAVGRRKLLLVSSIPRCNAEDRSRTTDYRGQRVNHAGWTLEQGVEATCLAAESFGRQSLLLYRGLIDTPQALAFATVDGLHPNEVGDILIASRIYQKLMA